MRNSWIPGGSSESSGPEERSRPRRNRASMRCAVRGGRVPSPRPAGWRKPLARAALSRVCLASRGSCCMQRLPKTLSGQPGATCLLRTTYDGASCLWWSPARTRAEVDLSYHVRAVLWGAGAARCLWPPLRAARHFCNRQVAGSPPRAPPCALAPPRALGAPPLKCVKTMKEG